MKNEFRINKGNFTDRNMKNKNTMLLDLRPISPYHKEQLNLHS
jgi:hypothetical protein